MSRTRGPTSEAILAAACTLPMVFGGCRFGRASNEVVIKAREYSFELPGQVPSGGRSLRLENKGQEMHQARLVRLDEGKSLADLQAYLTQSTDAPPDWITQLGGPNAARPGGSSSVFVDLAPGAYALLCGIPGADGVPHFSKGMTAGFSVVQSGGDAAAAPVPDTTIVAKEFAFELKTPVTAGPHVIAVENRGSQAHEAALIRLAPGIAADQYASAFSPPGAPAEGPPGEGYGGVVALEPGTTQIFSTELDPGHYALLCFVRDPDSNQPHVELGMQLEFDVG